MIKQLRTPGNTGLWKSVGGFSLFELTVFIIAVAIIYAAAARRFAEFPGEAERANFLAITTQLQTGINLETYLAMSQGNSAIFRELTRTNPMDLLLETPSNYIGAFDLVNSDTLGRRIWYYDLRRNHLVYRVNDTEGVYLLVDGQRVPAEEIRFRIQPRYRTVDPGSGLPTVSSGSRSATSEGNGTVHGSFSGFVLEPILPFEWDSDIMQLAGATAAES